MSKLTTKKIINDLQISGAWEFERVIDCFRDDKIEVSRSSFFKDGSYEIKFAHSSHHEAMLNARSKDGSVTSTGVVIKQAMKAMGRANRNDSKTWPIADCFPDKSVSRVIVKYSDRLPEEIRITLFDFAETEETADADAFVLANDFEKISERMRIRLSSI